MSSGALNKIRDHIYGQFSSSEAQQELKEISNAKFDWVTRTKLTIETLLPQLPDLAKRLSVIVPRRLNSAFHLSEIVKKGQDFIENTTQAKNWYSEVVEEVNVAQSLIGHIQSQQVSAEIQRQTILDAQIGRLMVPNGNSIYPDLILKQHNYSGLEYQSRAKFVDGPCLQGKKQPRPSNVPDGCEIKTNQGTKVRVDAHGAHPGLHVGITWNFSDNRIVVNGVWGGYIRLCDHKESGRNVSVTTVKYSFGHSLFTSLMV